MYSTTIEISEIEIKNARYREILARTLGVSEVTKIK